VHPEQTGLDWLEVLSSQVHGIIPPVVVYPVRSISKKEEEAIRRYAQSIIIQGPKSLERLNDEVRYFLEPPADLAWEKSADSNSRHDRTFDGYTVMVVDDDLRTIFTTVSLLESKGFKVIIARDGEEAFAKLDQSPAPDAILMDIMMPKMDGYEVIRRIRLRPALQTIPIIVVTARTMKGESERCFAAGANAYIPKPVKIQDLFASLSSLIQAREPKRDSRDLGERIQHP
jgi:CheY-like chemotaxis protein